MHGDTMATVDADGLPTITAPTGPFGEQVAEHTAPNNAATGTSNDYLGVHRKASETDYLMQPIQMGARVYIPELGRFLQVDPVEGGTANNYVYVNDPVNSLDLNGKWSISGLFKSVVNVVKKAAVKVLKTVVATAKEVATAAVMYTKWLSANTRPVTTQASSYQWKATGIQNIQDQKSRGDGTYNFSGTGGLQIQGIKGAETIGGASSQFNGTLTISGNSWTFKGKASNITDSYNFNIRTQDGVTARNAANLAGQYGGLLCAVYTLGACKPTDYDVYISGSVSVEMSGTF